MSAKVGARFAQMHQKQCLLIFVPAANLKWLCVWFLIAHDCAVYTLHITHNNSTFLILISLKDEEETIDIDRSVDPKESAPPGRDEPRHFFRPRSDVEDVVDRSMSIEGVLSVVLWHS